MDGALMGPCDECLTVEHQRGLTVIYRGGGFEGGPDGRKGFHETTIGETQRKWMAGWERDGIKAEPVGSRWV